MLRRYAEAQPFLFNTGIVTDKQNGNMTESVAVNMRAAYFDIKNNFEHLLIKAMFLYIPHNLPVKPITHHLFTARPHSVTYLRGTDVIQFRINYLHRIWQRRLVYRTPWTAVHHHAILTQYLIMTMPLMEIPPIVGTYYQREHMLGIRPAQRSKSVHHIRRYRQVALKVRHLDMRHILCSQPGHTKPVLIRSYASRLLFLQWIQRGDQQPQLIHQSLLQYRGSQLRVPIMYWIERASIYSYPHATSTLIHALPFIHLYTYFSMLDCQASHSPHSPAFTANRLTCVFLLRKSSIFF